MPRPRQLAPITPRRAVARTKAYADKAYHLAHALKNDIVGSVERLRTDSQTQHQTLIEQVTDQHLLVCARLSQIEARLQGDHLTTASELDLINKRLIELIHTRAPSDPIAISIKRLDHVNPEIAELLNSAYSADGPLREAGLFINSPLTVLWHPNEARLEQVNERIVEVPFAFRALSDLPAGSNIVDVGGGESTIGLSLASMGYIVDLVEPNGFPVKHPNLTVHEKPVETLWDLPSPDAIVLLSTIEHIGISAYVGAEQQDLDLKVMQHLWAMSSPGTLLVLTTPYGTESETSLQRTYDPERLTRLLLGWELIESRTAVEIDQLTWIETDDLNYDHEGRTVALIVAKRSCDIDYANQL